jgi:gas vesicle protein
MAEQKTTKIVYEQPEINLFELLENRRVEAQDQIETLHKRIGALRDELYEEVASSHKEIMKEIKEMKEESKAHHEKMDDRLNSLERWKWIVVGGASAIGFLVALATDVLNLLT